jgi:tetratricopeptide (TPR) repeat protein
MKTITPLFAIFLILSCASTQSSSSAGSLDDGLEKTAAELVDLLPQGSRIAVVNFDSNAPELSTYLIDEANGYLYLHNKKVKLVTRKSLDLLMKELDWNMSGYVSDETAQSIGKMMGVEIIISGALVNRGSDYRLRLTAIQTETAQIMGSSQSIVRNDKQIKELVASIQTGGAVQSPKSAVAIDEADKAFSDGYAAYMSKNYDTAIAEFTKAIGLNPLFAYAYLYRGVAYNGKGDQKQTIANIDKAIELYPKFDRAYFYRGKAYSEAKDYERAVADYSKAITLNAKDADYYYRRGLAYAHMEKYELEIADYSQFLSLKPDDAEAYYVYYMRGTAYMMQQNFNSALSDFTKSIEYNRNFDAAYRFRATLYALHGEFFKAIEDCNQALKINPKNNDARELIETIRKKM